MEKKFTPHLTIAMLTLQLRNPFRLSNSVSETRRVYWIRLAEEAGWGEGAIPPYYGVDEGQMISYWHRVAQGTRPLPQTVEEIPAWVNEEGPAVAHCAAELAVFDYLGRSNNIPLYQMIGLPKPQPMPTSFTIAIATPDEMARLAVEAKRFPILKIKLGSDDDEARLSAIRSVRPEARLRVDANAGWTLEQAFQQVKKLERFNLEMIEQPLPKEDIAGLGKLQAACPVPIVADESVQTLADIEKLAAAGVQGVNLKLMKIGGIFSALKMLKRAKELGLKIMLGSMIETSLGTTAMAHFISMADWVDLDAPLLISNDPFDGILYDENANVSLPDRPGIGVIQRVKSSGR